MKRAVALRAICCNGGTIPEPVEPPTAPTPLLGTLLTLVNERVTLEISSGIEPTITGVLSFVGTDYVVVVEDDLSVTFVLVSQIETVTPL
ncbi:hypothetical protein A2U94_00485 [Bacillus sp. VT 712]|uniref:hypothetical protein n=1 Tax=Bacillaceae TaxID=186817 RepID=UPI000473C876|nr:MULTISPECIES: hypothetical protein [Bacillaceae]KZB93450.1 hypothetical protein A2U94_00485 [Bacillus sp. VT 712]